MRKILRRKRKNQKKSSKSVSPSQSTFGSPYQLSNDEAFVTLRDLIPELYKRYGKGVAYYKSEAPFSYILEDSAHIKFFQRDFLTSYDPQTEFVLTSHDAVGLVVTNKYKFSNSLANFKVGGTLSFLLELEGLITF